MKAMILAAGLGTRLKPLTDTRPKALVELSGRTLLEIALARLRTFGITEFIINVHHFADQVTDYLKSRNNFGLRIEISREDDLLLDTGGGLKKAAWFFLEDSGRLDEPFLLHNVDVISTIDLRAMLLFHTEHHALTTLAVQSRDSSRQLLFNNNNELCGRRIDNKDSVISSTHHAVISAPQDVIPSEARDPLLPRQGTASAVPKSEENPGALAPEGTLHPLAFSGIHILSPRLLPLLTEEGVFSIIDSYLRLSAQGQRILAFRADEYYWRDLGRSSDLAQAALDFQQNVHP